MDRSLQKKNHWSFTESLLFRIKNKQSPAPNICKTLWAQMFSKS